MLSTPKGDTNLFNTVLEAKDPSYKIIDAQLVCGSCRDANKEDEELDVSYNNI